MRARPARRNSETTGTNKKGRRLAARGPSYMSAVARQVSVCRHSTGPRRPLRREAATRSNQRNRLLTLRFRAHRTFADRLVDAFEVALRVECSHTAGARARDRLTVHVILHVAGCEHARHARARRVAGQAAVRDDVAVLHLKLARKEIRVR